MIKIFCNKKHSTKNNLCSDCNDLLDYAINRLSKCPYQEKKPTCGKCTIHCFQGEYREKVKEVMRFSGKRMLFKHPILTIKYLRDRRKSKKILERNQSNK